MKQISLQYHRTTTYISSIKKNILADVSNSKIEAAETLHCGYTHYFNTDIFARTYRLKKKHNIIKLITSILYIYVF